MSCGPKQMCLCFLLGPADLTWSQTDLYWSPVLLMNDHTRVWLKAGHVPVLHLNADLP